MPILSCMPAWVSALSKVGIVLVGLLTVYASAYAAALSGEVAARQDDRVLVRFTGDGSSQPQVGDIVTFSATIAGLQARAGAGTVAEVGADGLWVEVVEGNPKLGAAATIQATGEAIPIRYQFEMNCTRLADRSSKKDDPCVVSLVLPPGMKESRIGGTFMILSSGKRPSGERGISCIIQSLAEHAAAKRLKNFVALHRSRQGGTKQPIDWSDRPLEGKPTCLAWRSYSPEFAVYQATCTDDPSSRWGPVFPPAFGLSCKMPTSYFDRELHEPLMLDALNSFQIGGERTSALVMSRLGKDASGRLDRFRLRLAGADCGKGYRAATLDLALPEGAWTKDSERRLGIRYPGYFSFRLPADSHVSIKRANSPKETAQATLLSYHHARDDWLAESANWETTTDGRVLEGASRCIVTTRQNRHDRLDVQATCTGQDDPLVYRAGGETCMAPVYTLNFIIDPDDSRALREENLVDYLRTVAIRDAGAE